MLCFCFYKTQEIVDFMKTRGHAVTEYSGQSAMTGISVESDGYIYANSDYRKGGDVAGIDQVD